MFLPAIALVAAALASEPPPAPPLEATREHCAVMVRREGKITTEVRPDLHLLGDPDAKLAAPKVQGELSGLLCGRDSIVPALGDERVLTQLHVPIFLSQGERSAALELSTGQIRIRLIQGQLSDPEAQAIQARLNLLQNRVNAAETPAPR